MTAPKSERIVRWFRVSTRLALFVGAVVAGVAGFYFHRSHRRSLLSRARWLQRSCRRALRILRVNYSVGGRVPTGSIIVANHLGYVDVLVLAALTPVVFVAKREVRSWPIFGWFARMAGTRFIDRERRADVVRIANELAGPLKEGVNVVLFLEGTSTDGQGVLPFKPSLLEPAVRHGWPVTPAAMTFRVPDGHSARDEVCWWGDMTLAPHLLNLVGLPWVDARVACGEPMVAHGDRKQVAAELHTRVGQLLAALRDPGETCPIPSGEAASLVDATA